MDKTININLGGSLFQVDEEAFEVLRDYIQAINNRFRNVPGGPETIEDIESRIAEIFRSSKSMTGAITKTNVESMIATIGRPEDFETDIPGEESYSGKNTSTKRLYRNPDDSVISGVCGGIGAYLNTDPVIFRILFVIFTFFGGAGLLIYIVFWIAVPPANTESRKKEMYGKSYISHLNSDGTTSQVRSGSAFNSGINEVIKAIGKLFYLIFRIFLVVFGTSLMVTGFLFIMTFLMIFVFRIPDAFTHHNLDFSVSYLPNLLEYIFNPSSAPWIWALTVIVLLLPMIALIYWGVRMIFWFKVNDTIFNLSMFIIWVVALAALSILVFNEGVSFAESSSVTSRNNLLHAPDTLYVVSGNKINSIDFDQEFSSPDDDYTIFIVDSTKNLYIKPRMRFNISDDNSAEIEVRKRASGRNKRDAGRNAETISYNYELSGDTLIIDEYFLIPAGRKWTADFVNINIHIPENTVIYLDQETAGLLSRGTRMEIHDGSGWEYSYRNPERMANKYWMLTDDGLKEAGRKRYRNN